MIQWNELRITPDGKNLIIDVSVDSLDYYDKVVITDIIIDNQENHGDFTAPSENPVFVYNNRLDVDKTYSVPENDNCNPVLVEENQDAYCFTYNTEKQRHVRLIIPSSDIKGNLNKDLLFVYVRVNGPVDPKAPCGWDNIWSMKTVCNLLPIYQDAMDYVKEASDECTISTAFIDRILEYKAFTLAIRTGNYILAIKYWNKFFINKVRPLGKSLNCRCNGLY